MSLSAIQVLLDRANAGDMDDPDDAPTRRDSTPTASRDRGDALMEAYDWLFPSRGAAPKAAQGTPSSTPTPVADDSFKPSAALDLGDLVALAFEKNFPKRNGGSNQ
jgi:hypothetical protein